MLVRHSLIPSLAVLLLACSDPAPAASVADVADAAATDTATADIAAEDAKGPPPCPPPPPAPGEVRARTLACPEDLPTGPMAIGRVGDVVLENAAGRFVLRVGPEGHAMVGLPGGQLVDAVRLDAEGRQQGEDGLREYAIAADFYLVRPDAVTVVDDGSDGEARVRVSGGLMGFALFQDALPFDEPDVVVSHEYVLAPDAPVLELRTTLRREAPGAAVVSIDDVAFWRAQAAAFLPGLGSGAEPELFDTALIGFAPVQAAGTVPAYAVASAGSRQLLDAAGILAMLWGPEAVAPDSPQTLSRFLALGDDLAAAMALASDAAGLPLVGASGTVAPTFPGVRVEARDDQGRPLTRCRPDPDGAFACEVPPETTALAAVWVGDGAGGPRHPTSADAVEVPFAPAGGPVDVPGPSPGALRVTATDGDGAPLPFRLDAAATLDGAVEELKAVDGAGDATVWLPPGDWHLWISAGPERGIVEADVTVVGGAAVERVDAVLPRVVDSAGWLAVDLHVHAEQSTDANMDNGRRLLHAAAEGLDWFAGTDHEFVTDYAPWLAGSVVEGRVATAPGVEVSTTDWGHFNVYPMPRDPDRAGDGAPDWAGLDVDEVLALLHAEAPNAVIQCNHPRYDGAGLFDAIALDPAAPPAVVASCDALELINGVGHGDTDRVVFEDWWGLLGAGVFVPGTGASDTHGAGNVMGSPRTLVYVGVDADGAPRDVPGGFGDADVVAALEAGRAVATGGPVLTLALEDGAGQRAGVGDTLTAATAPLELVVRLEAPDWLPLGTLRVVGPEGVVHEEALDAIAPEAGRRLVERRVAVAPTAGTDAFWFAAHVPGDERARPMLSRPAWAITNPVFLDGDGDGRWR